MKNKYDAYRKMVEEYLEGTFCEDLPQKEIFKSMRYSLLAGGKRIRPVMILAFCEACGGEAENALPFGAAIEMIHTYSLIHDDLPCMDDDDYRRGKLTNHKVFGECMAVLAGDALQTEAFREISKAKLPAEAVVKGLAVLSEASGAYGMCGGQVLDMECENKTPTIEEIENVHKNKTAALIKAAAKLGVIAGGGNEEQLMAAEKYADCLGLAFQIRDDVLDVISTAEELGKPIGSDEESGKTTFLTLLGIDECNKIVREKTDEAKKVITEAFSDAEIFCWLADTLAERKN